MVGMTLWRGAQGCARAADRQDAKVPRSTGMRESGRRAGRTSAAEHRDARERPDPMRKTTPAQLVLTGKTRIPAKAGIFLVRINKGTDV